MDDHGLEVVPGSRDAASMVKIPSQCQSPSCRAIFPSVLMTIKLAPGTSAGQMTFRDNWEDCPLCGGPAKTAEGVFTLTSDAVEILSAAAQNRALLQAFQSIATDAAKGKISAVEAERRAARLGPKLGELVKVAANYGPPMLGALGTVAGLYLSYQAVELAKRAEASSDQDHQVAVQILEQVTALRHSSDGPPGLRLPGLGGEPYKKIDGGMASKVAQPPKNRR